MASWAGPPPPTTRSWAGTPTLRRARWNGGADAVDPPRVGPPPVDQRRKAALNAFDITSDGAPLDSSQGDQRPRHGLLNAAAGAAVCLRFCGEGVREGG